jgi:hypothetical protein
MQTELRLLGEAGRPSLLTQQELDMCRSTDDAIQMVWHKRVVPYTVRDMSALISMDKGNFSRVLNGGGGQFWRNIIKFEEACQVYGVTQYLADQHGKILIEKPR